MSSSAPPSASSPQPAPAASPVTVMVSRRIKPGQEARYLALMQQMVSAAQGFDGHLGAQILPAEASDDGEAGWCHVLFAFDGAAHLQAWQDSPARALGLAALEPLTLGEAQSRQVIGLAHWFTTPGASSSPPPRWKVAMVTWLGIFPTVLALFLTVVPFMADWHLVPRTLVVTGLVVLIMTWGVAPQLTRWLRPWLHRH